jgi:hypothetical protein
MADRKQQEGQRQQPMIRLDDLAPKDDVTGGAQRVIFGFGAVKPEEPGRERPAKKRKQ